MAEEKIAGEKIQAPSRLLDLEYADQPAGHQHGIHVVCEGCGKTVALDLGVSVHALVALAKSVAEHVELSVREVLWPPRQAEDAASAPRAAFAQMLRKTAGPAEEDDARVLLTMLGWSSEHIKQAYAYELKGELATLVTRSSGYIKITQEGQPKA